jgi:ribosomal protein S25
LSEVLAVNYSVAQRYVLQLESAAIVTEITGQARNRVYRANEILTVVARDT